MLPVPTLSVPVVRGQLPDVYPATTKGRKMTLTEGRSRSHRSADWRALLELVGGLVIALALSVVFFALGVAVALAWCNS